MSKPDHTFLKRWLLNGELTGCNLGSLFKSYMFNCRHSGYDSEYMYIYITGNSFSLVDLEIVIFLDFSTVKYHCYRTGNKYVHITYRISADFIS